MEQKDLQQIKELFQEGFQEEFSQIWENNLNPAFEDIYIKFEDVNERFEDVNERFDDVNKRFDDVNKRLIQLPDKSYLDDKLADLSGSLIIKLRKEDDKLNRLVEI